MENNLYNSIEDIIESKINSFIDIISKNHDIEIEILKSYWNNNTSTISPKNKEIEKYCSHVYSRGNKKGEKCDVLVKSIKHNYCSKHRGSSKRSPTKKNLIKKPQLIIKTHPTYQNYYYHPETQLLFNKQKLVVGRIDDKDLVKIDEKCREICKTWKFKISQENELIS